MKRSECIQCWVPAEIVQALDLVKAEDFRSRSSVMARYVVMGLRDDAERLPAVNSVLDRIWEASDDGS